MTAQIRAATKQDQPAWDRFVAQMGVPPTALWGWTALLESCYPIEAVPLLAEEGGEVIGVLMCYLAGRGAHRRLHSTRYGLLAYDDPTAARLVEAAAHRATEAGAAWEVTSGPVHHALRAECVSRTTVMLSLRPSEEETWASLRDKSRNLVRKAQRHGLEVRWGWQHAEAFWRVYRDEMVARGVTFHRRRFFPLLARHLDSWSELVTVSAGGVVVGGTVVLFGRKIGLYPYQAVRQDYRGSAPSQLMIWEIARACVARGIATVDMGESTLDGATFRFKVNFGGQPVPMHYYRPLAPVGTRQGADAQDGRSRVGRLPSWALRLAGPALHGRRRAV